MNEFRKFGEAFIDCSNIAGLNGSSFRSKPFISVGYPLFFFNFVDNHRFLHIDVPEADLRHSTNTK